MRGGAATDTGVLGAESALNEWLLPERGLKRKMLFNLFENGD